MARKKQSLLSSAMILVASTIIVKIIGVLYKIPITNTIGIEGLGYFESAYNIYIPIYSIALAGLPVAISRMVAHYSALGRFRDIRKVQKIAFRLFFISGFLGMLLILLIAYPYSSFLVKIPKLFPLLIVLAPSVLMCTLMSSYRGYYNGLRNMYPSAVSEVVEAVFKAAFGIWLSKLVVNRALLNFHAGNPVFGQIVASEQEAITAAAPYSAVAAIAGVTISTVLALLFLVLRHRIVGDKITRAELRAAPRPEESEKIAKKLLAIALPIVLSSLIVNLTNLIDSTTLLNRLDAVVAENRDVIYSMYADSFSLVSVEKESMFLYGAYSIALTFKNILPTLSMTLGVSVIPVLAEAWTLKDRPRIKRSIESVLRVTMLISLPAGFGMAALAEPIIRLLYRSSNEAIAGLPISRPSMIIFGIFAFAIATSQPTTSMLQGLGRTDIPLYSSTIGAILKIALNFVLISIPRINIFGALISTIVCYLVMVIINYTSLIKITKVRPNMLQIFFKPLFCALLCAVTAWLTYSGLSMVINPNVATLIAIGMAVLVYGLSLLYTRTITKSEVKMLPFGKKISPILERYKFIG